MKYYFSMLILSISIFVPNVLCMQNEVVEARNRAELSNSEELNALRRRLQNNSIQASNSLSERDKWLLARLAVRNSREFSAVNNQTRKVLKSRLANLAKSGAYCGAGILTLNLAAVVGIMGIFAMTLECTPSENMIECIVDYSSAVGNTVDFLDDYCNIPLTAGSLYMFYKSFKNLKMALAD